MDFLSVSCLIYRCCGDFPDWVGVQILLAHSYGGIPPGRCCIEVRCAPKAIRPNWNCLRQEAPGGYAGVFDEVDPRQAKIYQCLAELLYEGRQLRHIGSVNGFHFNLADTSNMLKRGEFDLIMLGVCPSKS